MPSTPTADRVRPAQPAETPASDGTLSWYARPAGMAWTLLVTSLVALAATIVIIVERSILAADPGHRTSCDLNPWVSCGRVMQSWQAMTFGFPNTYIGIVAFSVLITVAVSLLAGARFARWYWLLMNVGILAGFAFCVWLWYSAVYSIGTLCLYCMIVWAAMIPLFILLTVRNLAHGVIPAPPGVVRFATGWAGTLIAVAYVTVTGSVFVQFLPAFTGY